MNNTAFTEKTNGFTSAQTSMQNDGMREAVGVFSDPDSLQNAVNALETHGFERRLISVLGSESALKKKFGTTEISAQALEDHPDAPRSPDVKKEEIGVGQGVLVGGGMFLGIVAAALASGGVAIGGTAAPLAVIIGGAGGAGVGAGLAKLLGDKYTAFFNHQIERGGLLLWVATPTPEMEEQAKDILSEFGASDVHIHEFRRDENGNPVAKREDDASNPTDKLQFILAKHASILSQDKTLNEKIHAAMNAVKNRAANFANDTSEQKIEDAILYARDMAEEEQRIVAECHEDACGAEEEESEKYFALVHDLKHYNADYIQPKNKMAA